MCIEVIGVKNVFYIVVKVTDNDQIILEQNELVTRDLSEAVRLHKRLRSKADGYTFYRIIVRYS